MSAPARRGGPRTRLKAPGPPPGGLKPLRETVADRGAAGVKVTRGYHPRYHRTNPPRDLPPDPVVERRAHLMASSVRRETTTGILTGEASLPPRLFRQVTMWRAYTAVAQQLRRDAEMRRRVDRVIPERGDEG
jgi:hypothetical protein